MITIAAVVIVVVLVASAFGIVWSRRRTRQYQDQMRGSDDLRPLKDRVQDLENQAQELKSKRPS